jgi:lipoprotein
MKFFLWKYFFIIGMSLILIGCCSLSPETIPHLYKKNYWVIPVPAAWKLLEDGREDIKKWICDGKSTVCSIAIWENQSIEKAEELYNRASQEIPGNLPLKIITRTEYTSGEWSGVKVIAEDERLVRGFWFLKNGNYFLLFQVSHHKKSGSFDIKSLPLDYIISNLKLIEKNYNVEALENL